MTHPPLSWLFSPPPPPFSHRGPEPSCGTRPWYCRIRQSLPGWWLHVSGRVRVPRERKTPLLPRRQIPHGSHQRDDLPLPARPHPGTERPPFYKPERLPDGHVNRRHRPEHSRDTRPGYGGKPHRSQRGRRRRPCRPSGFHPERRRTWRSPRPPYSAETGESTGHPVCSGQSGRR